MHTKLYINVYFLNILFLFFINRNLLFSFPFLFLWWNIKYSQQNIDHSKTRINDQKLPVELCNSCVINIRWVGYLFVSCPKLILVSRFKSNWWAQSGFGTWPNYKASGKLLVELIILLWQTLGEWGCLLMSDPILYIYIHIYIYINIYIYT